jgi:hypothetical protein
MKSNQYYPTLSNDNNAKIRTLLKIQNKILVTKKP